MKQLPMQGWKAAVLSPTAPGASHPGSPDGIMRQDIFYADVGNLPERRSPTKCDELTRAGIGRAPLLYGGIGNRPELSCVKRLRGPADKSLVLIVKSAEP